MYEPPYDLVHRKRAEESALTSSSQKKINIFYHFDFTKLLMKFIPEHCRDQDSNPDYCHYTVTATVKREEKSSSFPLFNRKSINKNTYQSYKNAF